ncbi:EF-hand calcium-binding domain-containing protein 2 [Intoshia linei]|uniref:EF-hand calcium-binding domain-containing protein 2 n=1 Tax=Intoshia linei TaxID=1819745 RepID=A0A177BB73_9BILA|nr:EF-hand calcium-binding domain-containing protein 2 [Intoshia linei]
MDSFKENAETVIHKTQEKIKKIFKIFDHDDNNTIDVLEFGTVLRALGCAPSEGEINQLITELEEEQSLRIIKLNTMLPKVTKILMERKYKPCSPEKLLKAFQTLDTEKLGYLTQDQLNKYMTEDGEPFQVEELEEMYSAAIDSEKGCLIYENYINLIKVENEESDEEY